MKETAARLDVIDVFVTIGTDHHQFTRLLDWLDEWLERHPECHETTLVQHGQSRPSRYAHNTPFVPFEELLDTISRSRIVVVHAGPGSIFDARGQGRLPVCVPRDPALREIVDDHQQRFARHVAQDELVLLCEDRETFHAELDRLLANPRAGTIARDADRVGRTIDNLNVLLRDLTRGVSTPLWRQPGWVRLRRRVRGRARTGPVS